MIVTREIAQLISDSVHDTVVDVVTAPTPLPILFGVNTLRGRGWVGKRILI